MLTESEILQFIQEDSASSKKIFARTGDNYYNGNHDIKNYRLYYYNSDGELVEDTNRSNIKISHPFFTELTDQMVQYMLSGDEQIIKSDDPELQEYLDEYFVDDESFLAELYDVLTGCATKGFEYMYAYKNSDDRLAFECADSIGVVEVRAKDTDSNTENVIYWYVDRIEKGHKKIKRIQVWDKDNVYYYVQDSEGALLPDNCFNGTNVKPHIVYTKEHDSNIYFDGFGYIPFFRLDYNKKQISALKSVKELIDDYDLMSCGLSNNLQDASEYLVVARGFQGDNIEELMQNVKTKKHIAVDENGDIEFKTVDIPYEARKTKLELDDANIYRFGMGFNSSQTGDGNITNVVIKSRYALLDLKCNKLEIKLKKFLRSILKIVLNEINTKHEKDFRMKDIYFDFNREVMTNAADNAQIEKTDAERRQVEINTLLSLANTLDDETIVQLICDSLDINYQDIKDKLPADELIDNEDAMSILKDVVADE